MQWKCKCKCKCNVIYAWCTYAYIWKKTHVYIYIYICVCVCSNIVYICIYIYIYIHITIHIRYSSVWQRWKPCLIYNWFTLQEGLPKTNLPLSQLVEPQNLLPKTCNKWGGCWQPHLPKVREILLEPNIYIDIYIYISVKEEPLGH